jgi:hypothetical protein
LSGSVSSVTKKTATPAEQGAFSDPALFGIIENALGSGVASCQLITSLPGPIPRRAYRATLKDGRVVKVRQVRDEARAEVIAGLLGRLGGEHFPPLLARVGAILLLPWIPGKPLNSFSPPKEVYRICGGLLAGIHLTPCSEGIDSEGLLSELLPRLLSDVGKLQDWEVLAPEEAEELSRQLQIGPPVDSTTALIHGDFCGENLVLGRKQTIFSIDNEALNIGLPEADIARALLRWSLTESARQEFLAGYDELRPLADYYDSARFWRLVSLIRSLRFRFRCPGVDLRPELSLLKQTLRERDL